MSTGTNIDLASAIALGGVMASAVLAFAIAKAAWGHRGHERLERETGLPLVGKIPMEAVYAAIVPIGRGLARIGVSANAVSVASLAIAGGAGVLFATGKFGAGAAMAVLASVADAIDGIVARESHTQSRLGRVLDTTIDRYVDALLVGGIAVFVRADAWLLALCLGALVGGFMVSYASSVLRELSAPDSGAPMRRAHRLAYLLGGAALVPFTELAFPRAPITLRLAPVLLALAAIAIVGNVSAVARLLRAAREPERSAPRPDVSAPRPDVSAPRPDVSTPALVSVVVTDRASGPVDAVVTRERLP